MAKKYTYRTWRNAMMFPLVLLCRAPIMLPLITFARIGGLAEAIANAISPYLPALKSRRL